MLLRKGLAGVGVRDGGYNNHNESAFTRLDEFPKDGRDRLLRLVLRGHAGPRARGPATRETSFQRSRKSLVCPITSGLLLERIVGQSSRACRTRSLRNWEPRERKTVGLEIANSAEAAVQFSGPSPTEAANEYLRGLIRRCLQGIRI